MKTSLLHSCCIILLLMSGPLCYGQFLQKAFLFEEAVAPEVDTFPSYPGGDEALENYIYTQLKDASKKMDQNILTLSNYRAVVQFQLDEKGNVNKQRIRIHESTPDMILFDEKIKEMIKSMPQWIPCIIGNTASPQTVGLIITYDAKMSPFDFK